MAQPCSICVRIGMNWRADSSCVRKVGQQHRPQLKSSDSDLLIDAQENSYSIADPNSHVKISFLDMRKAKFSIWYSFFLIPQWPNHFFPFHFSMEIFLTKMF